MTIKKGKTIALVGQSGSGKSTLANLILRFYDVNSGEILIDGINIKDIKKESLREMMGLVTQESILFNETVRNNITLGGNRSSLEEVEAAAEIANTSLADTSSVKSISFSNLHQSAEASVLNW